MPTLKNLSYGPITVQLADGSITLGPRESKEIEKADADAPAVQKYLLEGTFFIIPSAETPPAAAPPSADEALAVKKDKPKSTQ